MENNLPQGWVECSIGEILSAKKGKKPASVIDEPRKGFVPYILIDEMEGKPIRAFTNDPKVSIITENEVLLVWDGSIGKCGSGMTGAIGSTLVGLKPLDNIPTKFLEYTIKHQNNFIKETSTGTGLQHINKDFFEICLIPLPPIEEQHRIVAKLDAVMQNVESNKQRLEKIPIILKRFRQSVLIEAYKGALTNDWRELNASKISPAKSFDTVIKKRVVRKRTEIVNDNYIKLDIPDSWIISNIDSVSDFVVDCPHSTPKWSTTGKVCLRTSNFLPNKLNLAEIKFVSEAVYLDRISRLKPQNGDVLYSREGGILGIACVLDLEEEVCLGQRMMMFRLNQTIDSKFICYFLNSPIILTHVNSLIGGSAAPHINVGDIKEYPIPFPSFEEQKEIVKRVEQLFAFADKLEARYTKAKTMIDKLPQSILAKAFRGELVSQNPNDEPASVLLERIKKEKEKLAAEKNGRKSKAYSIEEKPLRVAAEGKVKYKKKKK